MTHEERFDIFWTAYPRKIQKGAARKKFVSQMQGKTNEEKDALLRQMLETIEQFKKSPQWMKDNGAYIVYPERWIKRESWHDEWESPKGIYVGNDELEF